MSQSDGRPKPTPEMDETVSFHFSVYEDDWDAWKESIPRSQNLDERLRELIREDTD